MSRPRSALGQTMSASGTHGAARYRSSIHLIALLLLVAAPARAEGVTVTLSDSSGECGVRGGFLAPVPGAIAWAVLTDYDGIARFVKSMHSSRMELGEDGRRLLRQDAVARVFLVRRHMRVLLEIHEDVGRRIDFHDVLGKDFRRYVGAWRVSGTPVETKVEYELVAAPTSGVARALCRGMLRNTARDLLEEVRAEMMRRAARASTPLHGGASHP